MQERATRAVRRQCVFHVADGLREGLSHFSQASRAAVIYAVEPGDALRVYDPLFLLSGHEPKLKEFFLDTPAWREGAPDHRALRQFEQISAPHLYLSGLLSYGCFASAIFSQTWFTEHHPDLCSVGPTIRWLEFAAGLMAQNLAAPSQLAINTAGTVLQGYTVHAVRDHIVDLRNHLLGLDTHLRIYPILDAVLAISKTLEEGSWPRGQLAFVEPGSLAAVRFLVRFPDLEQPYLERTKHVRKLLQAVEGTSRALISDGRRILGIAGGVAGADVLPPATLRADFRGNHGFLNLDTETVCSFSDGNFHSSTRRAKLVQFEEMLLESGLDLERQHELFQIVAQLVHSAEDRKHGCTLVVDLAGEPLPIAGQGLEEPLDLGQPENLSLACSLARLDGALHLRPDLTLRGFACLLDGRSVPGEDRARGARYNSALRFTAGREDVCVVVVSSDRPVSIIRSGVELTATCLWKPPSACEADPPTLAEWVKG
jgi:hypothetical protein